MKQKDGVKCFSTVNKNRIYTMLALRCMFCVTGILLQLYLLITFQNKMELIFKQPQYCFCICVAVFVFDLRPCVHRILIYNNDETTEKRSTFRGSGAPLILSSWILVKGHNRLQEVQLGFSLHREGLENFKFMAIHISSGPSGTEKSCHLTKVQHQLFFLKSWNTLGSLLGWPQKCVGPQLKASSVSVLQ